jgi:hypothetical protein
MGIVRLPKCTDIYNLNKYTFKDQNLWILKYG